MSLTKKLKTVEESSPYFDSVPETGVEKLLRIEEELTRNLQTLKFGPPIEYVYNPLVYAKDLHLYFVRKYFTTITKNIMFLGMNPGPWGMAQNGIPFGENKTVKEWFQISNIKVGQPEKEHPSRKITGLECHRSEVSGKKFWGLFKDLCRTPENFFKHSFVYNICPLTFMTLSGKNVTPAEIKGDEQKCLNRICDEAFIKIIKELEVNIVIGIGKFAEKRAQTALKKENLPDVKILSIPHPSPRNLKNNANWSEATIEVLQRFELMDYFTGKLT